MIHEKCDLQIELIWVLWVSKNALNQLMPDFYKTYYVVWESKEPILCFISEHVLQIQVFDGYQFNCIVYMARPITLLKLVICQTTIILTFTKIR